MHKTNTLNDLIVFVGIVAALIICGIVFIYSSSSIYAIERFGVPYYFVKKQLLGIFIGTIGLACAHLTPLKVIQKLSPLFFWIALAVTSLTMVPGLTHKIHGSSRWLNLHGFSFQPSELLKVAFILYVSYLLAKKQYSTNSFAHSYAPLLMVLGITSATLLAQPDFGLTVTLALTTFILLFVAHYKNKHLLLTCACFIPIGIGLIYFKPYRLARILTYLDPWSDPQGSGFQIIQSLIAIGSGGWWGLGISHSKQKFFYLPMQHTDFIFSIIAEETGFIGALFIIFLYILLLYKGLRLALQMHNPFCFFAIAGFVIMITLQALINLAVVSGLVPTKGISLPFISYGNSGLVCSLIIIGLIINMAHSSSSRA